MNKSLVTTTVVVASLGGLLVSTAPVVADGATQISGVSTFDDDGVCTERPSEYTLKMEAGDGDLVGCWYTDTLEVVQETKSGIYQERGTETFVGCLADGTTCGTFSTTYKFTAKFAADGSEIHGRCQHPIVDGTDDFEGLTGRVDFKDDVATGEFNYRGHLILP
ncbi:MAG TPA: hypothetical protein VLN74_00375 [Ilumatobacteraceae bacterium]|nr:hypothetical protein [Ilumatobacteraceae bacterium]